MATMDIAISFPSQGHIRLESRDLFAEPGNETCRQFLERVFQAPEITDVTINSQQKTGELPHADLRFCHTPYTLPDVVRESPRVLTRPGRRRQASVIPSATPQATVTGTEDRDRPTPTTRPLEIQLERP